MKRTQLYLDEDLWNALRAEARRTGSTISELVRQAARARYLGDDVRRRMAMERFVGIRSDRDDLEDVDSYLRGLRSDDRIERMHE